MEFEDINVIQLELKYCERCGGLWVRESGCEVVYCAPCAVAMMEMAGASKKRTSPRLPVNHKRDNNTERPKLLLLTGRGGNG